MGTTVLQSLPSWVSLGCSAISGRMTSWDNGGWEPESPASHANQPRQRKSFCPKSCPQEGRLLGDGDTWRGLLWRLIESLFYSMGNQFQIFCVGFKRHFSFSTHAYLNQMSFFKLQNWHHLQRVYLAFN